MVQSPQINNQFLSGGGEMGRLMRSKEWSSTPLGDVDEWPQSLRTTLSIILNSGFPMFLFWGPDLICFYNDAYRPSLGKEGKHPGILGMKAEDAWPEIWHIIKPLIDQVMSGGKATWSEDQLIPIYRNGKIEDVYWTFSYSPVNDEAGVAGVFITCTETTEKIFTLKKIEESERNFRNLVNEAPMPTSVFRGKDFVVELANDESLKLWGKDKNVIGKTVIEAIPELQDQPYMQILEDVYTTGIMYEGKENLAWLERGGVLQPVYVNFIYKALHDSNGIINGILCMGYDVTGQVNARKTIEENERYYQQLIEDLPAAIYTCDAEGYIMQYNKAAVELWGRTPQSGKDMWCGAWKIYNPDGSPVAPDECPMAIAIKEGSIVEDWEIIIETTDGVRKNVIPHPRPIKDAEGKITGAVNMLVDMTAFKQAEQKLRESEDRLRLATEGTRLATWDLNLQTSEVVYSPRLAKIFGHDESAILSHRDMRGQIHPDDLHAIVEKAFDHALQSGSYYYDARIIHPDKTIHWIRTQGKVIYDDKNVPLRMLGTMMDITEVKVTEEKISKLAAIVRGSDDAIISKTLEGVITSWNDSAQRIFGYAAAEMIGQPIFKLIPPDRKDEEVKILEGLRKGERFDHFETKRVTKDNRLLDVSLTISPVIDSDGNIVGVSKIARDITAQKKSEQQIRESEEKFRLLADSMPQFIWTGDEQGNLNYFNQSVYIYSGLTPEQLSTDGWLQIVHPNDREENIKKWMQSIETGEPFLCEHRFRRHDGSFRWQLSRAIPQRDNNGKIQMWVGTSTDIHDRKLFTDELENQVRLRTKELNQINEDLIKSNNELAQFAYVASHDLQEPLRKIQTFATRIIDSEESLSGKGKDYFTRMQSAAMRMQQLIIDLLSYSRTNTGEKHFEPTDLNELLEIVKEQLSETIELKQATISKTILPVLSGIPYQLEQLFTNILSNALKFCKPDVSPQIDITADMINGSLINHPSADPKRNYHHISISDNGVGFEPEYSERIFQVFQRLHGKIEYPGTGIGLAICKRIVENHHGIIDANSQPGNGATFNIYLPVEEP